MKTIIVYGTHYGSSKKYAKKLADITKLPSFSYLTLPKNCPATDTLIYIGSLYAGGIVGLAKTAQMLNLKNDKTHLILITVGLSDPTNLGNTDTIKAGIEDFSNKYKVKVKKVFHLRGNIYYKKLNVKHRLLMKMLYQSTKKKEPSELNSETSEFINTYGKEVQFIDFNTLKPIIEWLRAQKGSLF